MRRGTRRQLHPQVFGIHRPIGLRDRRRDPELLPARLAELADDFQYPVHHLSYSLISQS